MSEFVCKCTKSYKMRHYYEKHIKDCIKYADAVQNVDANADAAVEVQPDDNKQKIASLTTLFTRFENLLYSEGTVAEKAREDIISLMIIRLLEVKFLNDTIDVMNIDKYCYDSFEITADNIQYVQMKKLSKLSKEEIYVILKKIWSFVFAIHPVTKQLFRADRYLSVRSDAILAVMIRDLANFDFENFPDDCLAEVYQHFIHKQFKGEKSSRLGQHFTPTYIIEHMLNDVEDYLLDGVIRDPFCGTGGFLLATYNKIKKLNLTVKNPIDYIHGTEIDVDVFRYTIANMLIATGTICTEVKNISAFERTDRKYEMIFTNPPFGGNIQKGSTDTAWFAQTKTHSRNLLCLQLCMHLLASGGICSLVFPHGNEMNSVRKAELEVRTRLCNQFEIVSITYLQKGTFEYTRIETVIITFRRPETADFDTDIKFYELSDGVKNHLRTITRDELIAHKYSLNESDYCEKPKTPISSHFEIKKIEDIVQFKPVSKHPASYGKPEGRYPFIKSSQEINSFVDECDHTELCIIIGNGGNSSVHLQSNFSSSSRTFVMTTSINIKYLYYYLKNNKSKLDEMFEGLAIKHLSKAKFIEILIPVPSAEHQTEIVKIIDRMEETRCAFEAAIAGVKFEIQVLNNRMFKFPVEIVSKKLEELVKIDRGNLNTKDMIEGSIPFYRCTAINPAGTHNTHTFDGAEYILFLSGGGSENNKMGENVGLGNVYLVSGKTACTSHVYRIVKTDDTISYRYLYYYLKLNKSTICDLAKFAISLGNVSVMSLRSLDIIIPPVEIQEQYVAWARCIEETKKISKNKIFELKKMIENTNDQIRALFS